MTKYSPIESHQSLPAPPLYILNDLFAGEEMDMGKVMGEVKIKRRSGSLGCRCDNHMLQVTKQEKRII